MCGIAGSTSIDQRGLDEFISRLAHRGPDDRGTWREDRAGLAHTRLSIIDLSPGGHQPMLSQCGRWVIVFNGEIYNYRELRRELLDQGCTFPSSSDTEVLLALLARHGAQGLEKLAGMFAFALWDRERGELVLGRDRLGIKPLVYAELSDGGLAFASEIETLRGLSEIRAFDTDREALSLYLACLYIPAPLTAWKGISKLCPGHVLRWKAGRVRIEQWWQPSFTP